MQFKVKISNNKQQMEKGKSHPYRQLRGNRLQTAMSFALKLQS